MNAIEFEQKLRQLNPRLYIGRTINNSFNRELLSTGIYFREFNPDKGSLGMEAYSGLSVSEQSNARKLDETPDLYISWCTYKHIPEGNWYNSQGGITAKGWREILLGLSNKKYIDLPKARKVFKCPSLGLATYDTLTTKEKFIKYAK